MVYRQSRYKLGFKNQYLQTLLLPEESAFSGNLSGTRALHQYSL